MNALRDHDAVIGTWLDDGPQTLPAETRQAITVGIRTVTQRRSRIAWPLVGRGLPTFTPRRLSVALASAAVLVVAAAVGLNLDVDRSGIGNPPLPTTPDAWTRSSIEGPQPPHVHAITAGGPGLVAVGAYSGSDDLADIWTSSDGRTWTRVPGEELGPGAINDVTTGGPGLVAVGRGFAGSIRSAVWTSRDGLTWSRADDPIFSDARIEAVSAGGPGLVAVGWHHRAWFSSDGLTWELASVPPVPPDVYPGDDGDKPQVYMTDVAAAGDRLVAVGSMMMNDTSNEAVVWTSADGMTWTDVPLDRDVFPLGSSFSSVTGGPDGFIAIGDEAGGDPAAIPATMLTSPDGRRWSRVGSDDDPFRSTQPEPDARRVVLSSITAGIGGYVAVGAAGPCTGVGVCNQTEAVVWTSRDGRSWLRVPTGPVFLASDPSPSKATGASDVVSFGSHFVVLGDYEGDGAVWISDPPSE